MYEGTKVVVTDSQGREFTAEGEYRIDVTGTGYLILYRPDNDVIAAAFAPDAWSEVVRVEASDQEEVQPCPSSASA